MNQISDRGSIPLGSTTREPDERKWVRLDSPLLHQNAEHPCGSYLLAYYIAIAVAVLLQIAYPMMYGMADRDKKKLEQLEAMPMR